MPDHTLTLSILPETGGNAGLFRAHLARRDVNEAGFPHGSCISGRSGTYWLCRGCRDVWEYLHRGKGGANMRARVHHASLVSMAGLLLVLATVAQAGELVPAGDRRVPLDSFQAALQGAKGQDAIQALYHPDGTVRFVTPPRGASFSAKAAAGNAPQAALQFARDHAAAFGVESPAVSFRARREQVRDGWSFVRAQQYYGEVPVLGGQMVIGVDQAGGVTGAIADVLRRTRDLDEGLVLLAPDIDELDAVDIMLRRMQSEYPHVPLLVEETAELLVFAPEVLGLGGRVRLVWSLVISGGGDAPHIREQVYLDAHTGQTALRFSLVKHALDREIYDADNSTADPGDLVRTEGDDPTSSATNPYTHGTAVPDADEVYESFGDWYDWFQTEHGRDSIDDAGMTLSGTVRYCPSTDSLYCPFANAYWDGSRMYFGEGFASADDVVAHELTHGFTEYTSNLIYYGQSGAINECMSDVFGEFVDLGNGRGNDSSSVRWKMGEDLPVGAIRDMENPPLYGQPDSTCHLYWEGTSVDNGGVHINSGVANRLCSLLTDGGSVNGYTIPAMGVSLVADLYYTANLSLLPEAADHLDLYAAFMWIAQYRGYSASTRDAIEDACRAVAITPGTICDPRPENDDCVNATELTVGVYASGYTTHATGDLTLNCGYELNDIYDVWFRFTPDQTDTYRISACGSEFDTTLALISDNCGAVSVIDCNDDDCGLRSAIERQLAAGTSYLIRLAGYGGDRGGYALRITGSGGYTGCQDVELHEDFNSGIPQTWTLINNDGNDAYYTDFDNAAWVALADFEEEGDSEACSTSWYVSYGCSDDWLISPAIQLGPTSTLTWDASAYDPYFPDGYEVRISTTGTSMSSFLANDALFSTGAEETLWTTRSVNLAAAGFDNQTVYIAFRNDTCNGHLLFVDNIRVCGDAPAVGEIGVSPASHAFGSQDVHAGPSSPATVTISNVGANDLALQSVDLTGSQASHFTITDDSGETVLAAGEDRTVSVVFDPSDSGWKTAYLTILSDDPAQSEVAVTLWGEAYLGPDIAAAPAALAFGYQSTDAGPSASKILQITNNGGSPLAIASVGLTGSGAAQFAIAGDTGQTSLGAGQTRTVHVAFDPSAAGLASAALRVVSNDADEPTLDVQLTGTGFSPDAGVTNPVWVNTGFSGVEEGSETNPFNTLGEGADFVTVGGEVRLEPGTVTEALRIEKALRLTRP